MKNSTRIQLNIYYKHKKLSLIFSRSTPIYLGIIAHTPGRQYDRIHINTPISPHQHLAYRDTNPRPLCRGISTVATEKLKRKQLEYLPTTITDLGEGRCMINQFTGYEFHQYSVT